MRTRVSTRTTGQLALLLRAQHDPIRARPRHHPNVQRPAPRSSPDTPDIFSDSPTLPAATPGIPAQHPHDQTSTDLRARPLSETGRSGSWRPAPPRMQGWPIGASVGHALVLHAWRSSRPATATWLLRHRWSSPSTCAADCRNSFMSVSLFLSASASGWPRRSSSGGDHCCRRRGVATMDDATASDVGLMDIGDRGR
jgi:hypothetical protein